MPDHESDHVLNIAYNLLAGGQRLEHLEVRRNHEVYLDALEAERIPGPTSAGDFFRRFGEGDVERLMNTFNETRLRAWKHQPDDFFEAAFIDADGTLAQRRLVSAGRGHHLQRGVEPPCAFRLDTRQRGCVCGFGFDQQAPSEELRNA